MRARILYTAAAMCLLPVATWAQDGLRSASLPERPLTSTRLPERRDLFLAARDTYVPRPDRPTIYEMPYLFTGGYWYFGGLFMAGREGSLYGNERCAGEVRGCMARQADAVLPGPLRGTRPPYVGRAPRNGDSHAGRAPRSGPAVTPPAAAPGIPKTFYVIAGCYAGDKPPRPEWLPPHCDPSNVRVIPP